MRQASECQVAIERTYGCPWTLVSRDARVGRDRESARAPTGRESVQDAKHGDEFRNWSRNIIDVL